MRIGYGFDSHEFRAGIPLKIGGIALAHDKGLGGHSDGDVLLHAITDALLGAVAAPDIGALFPPSDPKWKGADSVAFLREALKRVHDAGYGVANLDASLILAAPKIGPHAAAIRGRGRRPSGLELFARIFRSFDLRGFDQGAEDGAGGFVLVDRALGMPLHR
jgi:2-C-methyl-D-erythritol 2,4-cyclodiphosphate synthase